MIVLANILLAVAAVIEPILFGHIIDAAERRTGSYLPLGTWVAFTLVCAPFYMLVARTADRMAHRCRADLLVHAYEYFVAMPIAWHNKRGSSFVSQTIIRACETLFSIWLEFMRTHLTTFIALFLLIPTAFSSNLMLASVLVALGLAYWFIGKAVMSRTKDGQTSVEKHYNNVFSHVSDTISNVSVLHSYNLIGSETNALRAFIKDLLDAQYPVLDWWAIAGVLNRMAATISMTAILIIGIALVKSGELSVGNVITFTGFATVMIGRLDQMRAFATQTFEASPKLEEFFKLQADAEAQHESDLAQPIAPTLGKVEFRNVAFAFEGGTGGVRNISFSVKPGQTVAIVGRTGAGKSTLVNLLQRIYDPQAGQILIDDVDISGVSRESVRTQIATVFQDAGLLNRSIKANIALGKNDASMEEIQDAAAAAVAEDFIEQRSGGFDAIVGEKGNRLSGGERQRIAIARAILKPASILILDEATSAMDVETEAMVKAAIDNVARNRTTFIIAHRLSTIRAADLVLVMDNGTIVESGGYEGLLHANGYFARLLRASGLAPVDTVAA
jgi:ATP-binding cassette subfamily B protein